MSKGNRSDRYALIAFGMALVAVVFAAWLSNKPTREPVSQPYQKTVTQWKDEPIISGAFWDYYTNPDDTYAQWLMTIFSALATGFSIRAVYLLRDSLNATRSVGRNQARAYVYVTKFQWMPNDGGLIAHVKNGGQTPARCFDILHFAGIGPKVAKPDNIPILNFGPIGPGESIPVPITQNNIFEIITNHNNRCAAGEESLFIVGGTITYETIYGEMFQTDLLFETHKRFANEFFDLRVATYSNPNSFRLHKEQKNKSYFDG